MSIPAFPQHYGPLYTIEPSGSSHALPYEQAIPVMASRNIASSGADSEEVTAVSPTVAAGAVQRLVSAELRDAGFDAAEPDAVRRLEMEVIAFVQDLYRLTHDYANLAARTTPVPIDLLKSCQAQGLEPKDLRPLVKKNVKKRKRSASIPPTLIPPSSRSPSPELLPSDDEGAPPYTPFTHVCLPQPNYLPSLPPKHTFLRTPASPPKKAALPSLDKKLKTAGLVQESLKNLLVGTDDSADQEDGELLGHIVNWEASTHPRKRWKV